MDLNKKTKLKKCNVLQPPMLEKIPDIKKAIINKAVDSVN